MMKRVLGFVLPALLLVFATACTGPKETSSDRQRETQERSVSEGVSQVGIPAIKNFRELKILKDIYELRDQTGLVTYTYTRNDYTGKFVFFCNSIGYPIPYAAQYSAPETVQRYRVNDAQTGGQDKWGVERLPQPEPNGLFSPGSAEGTWVMCKDPHSERVVPAYSEPKLATFQWKLPDWQVEGQNG